MARRDAGETLGGCARRNAVERHLFVQPMRKADSVNDCIKRRPPGQSASGDAHNADSSIDLKNSFPLERKAPSQLSLKEAVGRCLALLVEEEICAVFLHTF